MYIKIQHPDTPCRTQDEVSPSGARQDHYQRHENDITRLGSQPDKLIIILL